MKRILFLPLLQMPSGHHQVADALIRSLKKRQANIVCRKVDFLKFTSEWLEKVVTRAYLKWIHHAPQTYEKAYRTFASSSSEVSQHFQWYERLFLKKMLQMLDREQPDLIVCTHGFPSFLASRLKEKGKLVVPVVNVYTDFFINTVWGRGGIDYHFVADSGLKRRLMQDGIPCERITVTGIPVDDCFKGTEQGHRHVRRRTLPYRVLVSGGSNGLGNIGDVLANLKPSSKCRFVVLCGNNRTLYEELASLGSNYIQALPYISSRDDMNRLYDSVDAIITKPGGVTVSEALRKRLPVFVHSTLPGQETFNRQYLEEQGLIRNLDFNIPFEEQLIDVVESDWQQNVDAYHRRLEVEASQKILQLVSNVEFARSQGV